MQSCFFLFPFPLERDLSPCSADTICGSAVILNAGRKTKSEHLEGLPMSVLDVVLPMT